MAQAEATKDKRVRGAVGGVGSGPMFDVLQQIAGELDASANPALVARCAEFLVEHGEFDKAVRLFTAGKRCLVPAVAALSRQRCRLPYRRG